MRDKNGQHIDGTFYDPYEQVLYHGMVYDKTPNTEVWNT